MVFSHGYVWSWSVAVGTSSVPCAVVFGIYILDVVALPFFASNVAIACSFSHYRPAWKNEVHWQVQPASELTKHSHIQFFSHQRSCSIVCRRVRSLEAYLAETFCFSLPNHDHRGSMNFLISVSRTLRIARRSAAQLENLYSATIATFFNDGQYFATDVASKGWKRRGGEPTGGLVRLYRQKRQGRPRLVVDV